MTIQQFPYATRQHHPRTGQHDQVVDIRMPRLNGLDVTRALATRPAPPPATPLSDREQEVVRFLRYSIEQVGVEPLRLDWKPVLADSEDLFRLWATWGVGRQPDGA